MAKRAKKVVVEPEAVVEHPSVPAAKLVLLLDGSEVAVDEDTPARGPEVHVQGVPYAHVSDAPDGRWIYAPRDVRSR